MVGGEDHRNSSWTMGASKLCDSCKSATASLFCKPDSAFLCIPCDTKIHAANKLASRHARVWMCEVCEQAPAHVTCKADAASLCVACDRDIHSANPLARRHERFPVTPFYDSAVVPGGGVSAHSSHYLAQAENNNVGNGDGSEADEAEAASWLLPNLNFNASSKIIEANGKQGSLDQYDVYSEMDSEMDPYLDIEFGSMDQEKHQQNSSGADCIVPVQNNNIQDALVNEGGQESCLDFDFLGPAKGYPYYNNGHCISQSVSSSEVGVVPEVSAMIDVSNAYGRQYNNVSSEPANPPVQLSGVDREARVLRYREKRKNRKFEKTIRYASRKAYAETRPRIKGRFAKRTDIEVEVDQIYGSSPVLMAAESGYGIVPSF